MIDPKELERIRTIHHHLDHAAASQRPGETQPLHIIVDGVITTYTAEEVRKWPELKAELRAMLQRYLRADRASWGVTQAHFGEGDWRDHADSMSGYCADSYRRGLCLFREMLAEPKRDTIPVLRGIDPAEDAPVEFKEAARLFNVGIYLGSAVARANEAKAALERIVAKKREEDTDAAYRARVRTRLYGDPYTGHDIAADKLVAARTYEHPSNVRARKVAQLRAELDRPVPFPAEGRSERAMPRSNQR